MRSYEGASTERALHVKEAYRGATDNHRGAYMRKKLRGAHIKFIGVPPC